MRKNLIRIRRPHPGSPGSFTVKIKTDYWIKPIAMRNFDWTAVDDDTYDGTGPVGSGRTRDEAIADLLEQINMRYDDATGD
jgi:hypothetical protein